MNNEIKYIFQNVNEWLKFAEAKHAGIIVLNSAIILGVLTTYSNVQVLEKNSTCISLFILGVSIFLSLASQFPVTSNIMFGNSKSKANPNIYFFGDLAKISESDFVNEFNKSFNGFTPTSAEKDLINQILVNSKITSSKFFLFKICCYISVFAIGLLGLSTIIKILWL